MYSSVHGGLCCASLDAAWPLGGTAAYSTYRTTSTVHMRSRAVLVLAVWFLATSLTDAKGGGGRSSGGVRSSGGTGSRTSSSRYVSSGRTTTSGAAVPASCRGCYYRGSTGGFYSRVFIFTYLGTSYRCYSCGSRSYDRYSTDSMHVTLAAVKGEFAVKLRDQTGNVGATQLTLSDVNTTTAMSAAGVAFETSMRDKVVSDWAQWSASSTDPVATSGSLGLADDVAIRVTAAPGSCTGAPPCEPLVTVAFILLFEDPADTTSGRPAAHMAALQASCITEARCSDCGVPSSGTDAPADACISGPSCSADCAECVGTLGCTEVLPSGRRKGPWDQSSECAAVAADPLYTVESCSTFQVESIQLSSQLGDELPYDYDDDDGSGGVLFILLICFCCACYACARVNGGRQRRHDPSPHMSTVAVGHAQMLPSQSYGHNFQNPPHQVQGVVVATAVAVPAPGQVKP